MVCLSSVFWCVMVWCGGLGMAWSCGDGMAWYGIVCFVMCVGKSGVFLWYGMICYAVAQYVIL